MLLRYKTYSPASKRNGTTNEHERTHAWYMSATLSGTM